MTAGKSKVQTECFSAVRITKETKQFIEKRKKQLRFRNNKQYIAHLLNLDGLPFNPVGV